MPPTDPPLSKRTTHRERPGPDTARAPSSVAKRDIDQRTSRPTRVGRESPPTASPLGTTSAGATSAEAVCASTGATGGLPKDWRVSETLSQLVSLMREFPHWAIWRTASSEWSAARIPIRGHGPAPPDQPLTWIHAPDSQELRTRIRAVDSGAPDPLTP
jgi:hypothetical protein